jgi:phage shock protein PspC (stress-responsive transcriptional regulator)
MSMTDELERLQKLFQEGALTAEEFATAKARVIEAAQRQSAAPDSPTETTSQYAPRGKHALNQFQRSLTDKWIGGVCGGLSELTDIPTWAWRILFVLTAFLHGLGLIMYILLWIFVPLERPRLPAPVNPPPSA